MELGDYANTVASLRSALELKPHMLRAKIQLSRAYLANGDYDAARSILTTLADGKKKLGVVHFLLAEVFAAQGHYRQSVEEFQAGILNSEKLVEKYPLISGINRMVCSDEGKVEAYRAALAQTSEDD